jgi:hypothetical protein
MSCAETADWSSPDGYPCYQESMAYNDCINGCVDFEACRNAAG